MALIDRVLNFGKGIKAAGEGIKTGYVAAEQLMNETKDYGHSIFQPQFKADLAAGAPARSVTEWKNGVPETVVNLARPSITARDTPAAFLGAYSARLLTDMGNDATRRFYWKMNHPMAISDTILENAIGDKAALAMTPTQRGLVNLGATIPVAASLGIYDITNPGELFRPKGYTQEYTPLGADDRRISNQPGQELFERFFLQRQGEPLKYATAKADIPDLTPERYGNYMNFRYQEKGPLDLGLIKATTENLQGVPEARLLGVPVTIPAATAVAGGAMALNYAAKNKVKPGMMALVGLAGSTAGAAVGNLVNEVIAMANRPKLPDLHQYQEQQSPLAIDYTQQGIG